MPLKRKPRLNHLFKKKKQRNDILLFGKITRNNWFINGFFSFKIEKIKNYKEVLFDEKDFIKSKYTEKIKDNDFKNNSNFKNKNLDINDKNYDKNYDTVCNAIVTLIDKIPSFQTITQDNTLIFLKNKNLIRYNLLTKEESKYSPSIYELGGIIKDKEKIKMVILDKNSKILRVTNNEIECLQKIMDGKFKGYLEIILNEEENFNLINNIFDFKIIKKEIKDSFIKYSCQFDKIIGILKCKNEFMIGEQMKLKIVGFENYKYILELDESLDLSVKWD